MRDSLAFNARTVGRTCEVLVERKGKLPGQWVGKSPWLQSVHFSADAEIGQIVTVEITSSALTSLGAVPLAMLAA
jgi:tRNA-2-methylthio-N6-dimethylallyladenosine synthase